MCLLRHSLFPIFGWPFAAPAAHTCTIHPTCQPKSAPPPRPQKMATGVPRAVPETTFEVSVSKDTFKFNAAHFVAYPGFRERLHGHNYRVSVRVLGRRKIGPDGYVIDFGCIKAVTKDVCKRLNEHFLCPMRSNVIDITVREDGDDVGGGGQGTVHLVCEDGSQFSFPKADCAMLPIVHATAEELAIYVWGRILSGLRADYLVKRGIHTMEITVAEAVGQEAVFRMRIPDESASEEERSRACDVDTYIQSGEVVPMPCPTATISAVAPAKKRQKNSTNGGCLDGCQGCKAKLGETLQALADAINTGSLGNNGSSAWKKVDAKYLADMLEK